MNLNDEYIINENGIQIIGFTKDAFLIIGKTTNNESKEAIERSKIIGIKPNFTDGVLKSVEIKNEKYFTSKNIRIGDSISKVEEIYGNPKNGIETDIFKSDVQIGSIPALTYDNISFIYNENGMIFTILIF